MSVLTAPVAAFALDTALLRQWYRPPRLVLPVFFPPRLGRRLTGTSRQPRRPAAGVFQLPIGLNLTAALTPLALALWWELTANKEPVRA